MLKKWFRLGRKKVRDNYFKFNKSDGRLRIKGIEAVPGRVFYFPVPKTACTSVKKEIYRLKMNKPYVGGAHRSPHIHLYWEKRQVWSNKYHERVIVVRDPIKRFLSAFGNRVKYHGELCEQAIRDNCPDLLDSIPYFDPTIEQFIEYLDIYLKVPSIHHHCMPLNELLGGDLSIFTRVIPIEKLDQFQQLLETEYRQPVTFPREQTEGRKIPLTWLSRKQLDKLFSIYEEDYRLLEGVYSKELFLSEWLDAKQRAQRCNHNKNKKPSFTVEKGT